MEKLILSYYFYGDEHTEKNILPFNFESAEFARFFLDQEIQKYCQDWENYYGANCIKNGRPADKINFCGHEIDLWHLNGGSRYFTRTNRGYEIQTLEDWWNENCKN